MSGDTSPNSTDRNRRNDAAERLYETHEQVAAPVDPFLQRLVHLVTTLDSSFGITLTIGGVLVTGTLASAKYYFETFGESFAAGLAEQEDVRLGIRFAFQTWADVYEHEYQDEILSEEIGYIHLKDARIYVGNDCIPSVDNPGSWWRGRLSHVDGFILGTMTSRTS